MWTRRDFLQASAAALVAGLAHPARAGSQAQTPEVHFKLLRDGAGVFIGRGGTIGWSITPKGVVVVDAQFPDTAAACLAGLKERTEGRDPLIDVLINTHHHGDHTAGNGVFRPHARTLVAHERVPELQRKAAAAASPDAGPVLADTTFAETWRLDLGPELVRAFHHGPAHTGGDAIVVFERANVVHMGDLVFNGLHPFIDRPAGASIRGWGHTLERAADQFPADAIYVFGHGREGAVTGTRADLLRQRDYLWALMDHVGHAIQAGRSREEILKTAELPGFAEYAPPTPRST